MNPEYLVPGFPKVLVVEDNAVVRRVSVGLLKVLKCDPLEAESAEAALEILDRGTPVDLLFTDVIMPGKLHGFQLAHLARQRRPALKVLFTSGYSAEAIPFDDPAILESTVLSKPYGLAELANALRTLLA